MAVLRFFLTAVFLWAVADVAPSQESVDTDVDLLVEALGHPDSSIRQNARTQLQASGLTAAGALAKEVCQGEMGQAVAAAGVLALIGTDAKNAARRVLEEILNDPQTSPWRWSVAASVLSRVDPDRTGLLKQFIEGLRAESPLVQLASVQAIAAMAPAARDTQPELLAEARLGLVDLLQRQRRPFTEILITHVDTLGQLVAFRAKTPWLDDFEIIDALDAAGLDQDELRKLLMERSNPKIRVIQPLCLTFASVAACGCPNCLDVVSCHGCGAYAVTIQPSDQVRLSAAKRLIDLDKEGRQQAALILAHLIRNRYSRARTEAIKMAVGLEADGAVAAPALAEVLFEEDAELRELAARALGNIGPSASSELPKLERALEFEQLQGRSGTKVRVIEAMEDAIRKIRAPAQPSPAG